MGISEIKKAEWLPTNYRVGISLIDLVSLSSFAVSIFSFASPPFLADDYESMMSVIYIGIFSFIIGLILSLIKGRRTILKEDGIYLYKNKKLLKLIKYEEVNKIEAVQTLEDTAKEIVLTTSSHNGESPSFITVNCYNEAGELIVKMRTEPSHELPLILSILASHGCPIDDSFSLIGEKRLEKFIENQTNIYNIYQKYIDKTPIQIFFNYFLKCSKGVLIFISFFILIGLMLRTVPVSEIIPKLLEGYFMLIGIVSFFMLCFYWKTLTYIRQYK